jgi:hypothetical protein
VSPPEGVILGIGFHSEDFAFAFVVALAADQRGGGLCPRILPAAWAGVFRLAGRLLLSVGIIGAGLPAQREAGGLQLGESWPGVSINTHSNRISSATPRAFSSSAGGIFITSGVFASRLLAHISAVRCASISRISTRRPACTATTAQLIASVLLPLPPFCVTKLTIGMGASIP